MKFIRNLIIAGALAVSILSIATCNDAHAQTVDQIRHVNPKVLMDRFARLDDACRGATDDPDTNRDCMQRALVEQQLNIAGFERDERDAWHRVHVILTK